MSFQFSFSFYHQTILAIKEKARFVCDISVDAEMRFKEYEEETLLFSGNVRLTSGPF